MVPRVSKSRMRGRVIRPLSVEPAANLGSGSLKLSFFSFLITVRDGSDDPKTTHSYAAIGLDCWGTAHDAPLLPLLSMYI